MPYLKQMRSLIKTAFFSLGLLAADEFNTVF